MTETSEKTWLGNLFFVVLVAAVAGLFLLATVLPDHSRLVNLNKNKDRLLKDLSNLESKHDRLLAERRALKSDPLYVEFKLRERGFKRPGEVLYKSTSRRR